jgi:hypothetical protein
MLLKRIFDLGGGKGLGDTPSSPGRSFSCTSCVGLAQA